MYLVTDKHKSDTVHCPNHYDLAGVNVHLEPIDLLRHLDFLLGNAMKYLFRYNLKGKAEEDLRKAAQYLDWYSADGCLDKWDSDSVAEFANMFLLQSKNYHPALVHLLQGLKDPIYMAEATYSALVELEEYT